MTTAILIGPDRGLGAAFESNDIETLQTEDIATGEWLDAVGVDSADIVVLTDVSQATAIPVAKDRNPALRIVVYSPDTIPEFVRGQVDFAVDPAALSPEVVAEELAPWSRLER